MVNLQLTTRSAPRQASFSWALWVLLAMLLTPFAGKTEELAPPQLVIKQTSQKLLNVLERDKERIFSDPNYVYQLANDILVPHVDMYRVSRLVLGKHWRGASESQREGFSYEFRRLLVRTYAVAMKQFRSETDIRFLPLRAKEGAKDVVVNTRMSQAGTPPIAVDYRMHLKDGKWLAYDVKIEGISLVTNYRSNFARHIRQGGMDNLIARIADLNQKKLDPPDAKLAEKEPS